MCTGKVKEIKMKIYRDNIEIELTADEIEQAYRQYLYENDKEVLKIKLNEDDEETVEVIADKNIKYFKFNISITHTPCIRGHRKPTIPELYRYLKTHMAYAIAYDFSLEDIHDIEEIPKDEAYSRYGMQHIFRFPYIN